MGVKGLKRKGRKVGQKGAKRGAKFWIAPLENSLILLIKMN